MHPPNIPSLISTLLCLLCGLAVGWGLGVWAGVATTSTLLLLLLLLRFHQHLGELARLERWSHHPSPDVHLEGEGRWDKIFDRLYRHEKETRAELARRDADLNLFAAAGEALTDGIVTLDAEERIVWCNRTAARQLAIDPHTDRGQSIAHLIRHPEFIAYLSTRDFSRPLVMRFDRGNEEVLSLLILPYAGGNRLLQIRDVTQSERLDRMRRDFVANVSHELRTPLTVLAGFIETLRELPLTEEERSHYLGLMSEQSGRMLSIIQDLLTLSVLEASPPPENTRIDMAALLDRLYRDATALSGGQHAIHLEALTPQIDLLGSEAELSSAFGNLISNAIRYTPKEGHIHIRWEGKATEAVFSVTDSGLGIDPRHLPRLTERFYRADAGRSRAAGGTGLGLAIVKHALARHQSTLEITSEPGAGSCFTARFPASQIAN